MKIKLYSNYSITASITLIISGCSDMLELDIPKNQLAAEIVFSDSVSATGALNNIYFSIGNTFYNNFNRYMGLYADEYYFTLSEANTIEFQQSRLNINNAWNNNIWSALYFIVYSTNDLIEQTTNNKNLSNNVKSQLINEAKFLRAFSYFYLLNLYGEIPLLLQTNVTTNRLARRTDESTVYRQIIEDLSDAIMGLPENYVSNKVRANRWAATALLARVYLFQEDWQAAESHATAVIDVVSSMPLDGPDEAFIALSNEAILQIWTQNGFVSDATTLIPASITSIPQFVVTENLQNCFEDGDLRRDWINNNTIHNGEIPSIYFYPFKYKNRTTNISRPEYLMVLRLGEVFLIRAEAKARQGNIEGAIEDLNVIRDRAGIAPYPSNISQENCLHAIMMERQRELFGEWGHRFFDLKRTGHIQEYLSEYKSTWISTANVFPIPQDEIISNPNLIQNQGY